MSGKHWALVLLTAALFGSSFLFIKLAVSETPPMTIAAGRAAVAAIVVVVAARAFGAKLPQPGRQWLPILAVGVLTAIIPYVLIAMGQQHIDSSLGGILFATIPLFSLFFMRFAAPTAPLTLGRVAGAFIGLVGVAVVIGPDALLGLTGQIHGAALTLCAAASYAAGAVLARMQTKVPPLAMAAGQVAVAAPVLILAAAVIDAPWSLEVSTPTLVAIGAAGLVSTAFPVILFFKLVSEIGPARTSILTFFMPVFSVLLGTTLLGEAPGPFAYAGLALIVVGAILISREKPAVRQKG